MRFRDRAVLVTGGGRGIGQATALAFAEEGAAVAVLDVRLDRSRETVRLIEEQGGRGLALGADISRPAEVASAMSATLERFGRLDVLFNNAATPGLGNVTDTDEAAWDLVIDVSLKGAFLMCRAAIPAMLDAGGGAIVNTGSISGLAADYGLAAYNAAKGGLVNLTRSIALDYAGRGIRCNCVCPGATATRMLLKSFRSEEQRRRFEDAYPMRRLAQPRDIANAVLFLASDDASFITGAVLPVDGGLSAYTGQQAVWLE